LLPDILEAGKLIHVAEQVLDLVDWDLLDVSEPSCMIVLEKITARQCPKKLSMKLASVCFEE